MHLDILYKRCGLQTFCQRIGYPHIYFCRCQTPYSDPEDHTLRLGHKWDNLEGDSLVGTPSLPPCNNTSH